MYCRRILYWQLRYIREREEGHREASAWLTQLNEQLQAEGSSWFDFRHGKLAFAIYFFSGSYAKVSYSLEKIISARSFYSSPFKFPIFPRNCFGIVSTSQSSKITMLLVRIVNDYILANISSACLYFWSTSFAFVSLRVPPRYIGPLQIWFLRNRNSLTYGRLFTRIINKTFRCVKLPTDSNVN